MQSPANEDPLDLGGLDPSVIQSRIADRDKKKPNELEVLKEARLADKEKRLAQSKRTEQIVKSGVAASSSESPSTAPPPPKIDKSVLLDKISAYRERFPHLKKRNNVTAKSTIDEVQDELHYIELQLGSTSGKGGNIGALVLGGTMHALETVTRDHFNPLGLNLDGLGTVTQQNMAEFQPILDELMIKYNAGMYTSPEWRLALAIGATVITVNAANSNPEMARAMKSMNMGMKPPQGSADL